MESGVVESDVDLDSNDDDDQQTDVHEVELTAMQHRRRVVRNVDGQVDFLPETYKSASSKAKPTSSTAFGSQPNCLEFHDHADGNTEETLITDINYHYLIMSSDSGCKSDIYFNLHVAYKAYLLSYWLSI